MIYVDKSFIVPLSKLAKENSFIHKHVTKDFDFSVSVPYRKCDFRKMKSVLSISLFEIMRVNNAILKVMFI